EDLVGGDRHPVAGEIALGDGLAQGHEPEAVGIPRAAVLEGFLGRFSDHGRRVEVGLAELEVDDVGALPLQLLGALEDLDGEERLDGAGASSDHGETRGRPARRRRVARICRTMRGPSRSTVTLEPGWSAQLMATSVTR